MANAIENYQGGAWTALAYSARTGVPASNLSQVIRSMDLDFELCDPSDLEILQEHAPDLPGLPVAISEIEANQEKVQLLREGGLSVEPLDVFESKGSGILQRSLDGIPSRAIKHVIWDPADSFGVFVTAGKGQLEEMLDKAMVLAGIEPDTDTSPR